MGRTLEGRVVLVADDDADNAELLALTMGQEGADVRKAGTGREVLDILRDASWLPDVLLLDIALPDMNGYDLLRTIRRDLHRSDLPAIAVTGFAFEKDKQRAAQAGFTMHVTKPYEVDSLIHVVAEVAKAAHDTSKHPLSFTT